MEFPHILPLLLQPHFPPRRPRKRRPTTDRLTHHGTTPGLILPADYKALEQERGCSVPWRNGVGGCEAHEWGE